MKSQTHIRVKSVSSIWDYDLYGSGEKKSILYYFTHMGILIPINMLGIFLWVKFKKWNTIEKILIYTKLLRDIYFTYTEGYLHILF